MSRHLRENYSEPLAQTFDNCETDKRIEAFKRINKKGQRSTNIPAMEFLIALCRTVKELMYMSGDGLNASKTATHI